MLSYRTSNLPPQAKKVFQGKIFGVYQWEQEMFDGTTETFEKLSRPDTVSVIAVTKDKKIVITDQEQPTLPPCICLPGGRVDKGEDPLTAAKRELLEEGGYSGDNWELFHEIEPYPKIDYHIYTYIAKGTSKTHEINPDAGEKIQVREVTFEEFVNVLTQDKYCDNELALYLLRLQRDTLKFNAFRKKLGL